MPSGPRQPPPLGRARPDRWLVLDRVAAGCYALLILLPLLNDARWPVGIVVVPAGAAAFAVPIAIRRAHPLLALAVCLVGLALVIPLEPTAAAFGLVPMAASLYIAASARRPRTAIAAFAVCMAAVVGAGTPDLHRDGGAHDGGAFAFSFLFTTVWVIGYAVGMQRRHTEDLLRDQARLAQVDLEQSGRALAEERIRIARELHDVVAHSMSVITVQAAFGALVIEEQPARARDALAAIETTGRQALTEMRQLLGVLRDGEPEPEPEATGPAREEPDLAPAPGLADLARLAEQTAHAGVYVELAVIGNPRPLPPGIDLSAYRIVQEALTNVVKHAAVDRAQVVLEFRSDELSIEVTDDGQGISPAVEPGGGLHGPGHGLVGMRERVRLYDGSFRASPLPGRGFQVVACLPLPLPLPAHSPPPPAAPEDQEPGVRVSAEQAA